MAAASEYPPRNEIEKFQDTIEYLLEDGAVRMSAALSGIAACETAKKYEDHMFYKYDLSLCTDEKNDETCEIKFLNEAVRNAYDNYGSKSSNIAVFTSASTLKTCNEITKFNTLWSLVDGKNFQDINVLLLFEENFPRTNVSESIGILSYLTLQRLRCREIFRDNDFSAQAFASRLQEFHVEQEPENEDCSIVLNYKRNPAFHENKRGFLKPIIQHFLENKRGFLKFIDPVVLFSASVTVIGAIIVASVHVIWGKVSSMFRRLRLKFTPNKEQDAEYVAKTGTK